MRTALIITIILLVGHAAFAMTGGPFFSVGRQTTSMTVEAVKNNLEVYSPNAMGGREDAVSDRVMLKARYGILPGIDLSASAGAANLRFSELPAGYNEFSSDWKFAWGAGARVGLPMQPTFYQILAGVDYFGFQPKGITTNGIKSYSNEYLWHEVTPSASVGFKLGGFVPYIGVAKPYLFGNRNVSVMLRGQKFSNTGDSGNYSDGEQPLRGLLGLEWKLPEGYSIGAEAAATSKGVWTLTVSLAQVLK